MRQGRKSTKTNLLNNLKVALGTIWVLGWAISDPITVKDRSFNRGTTPDIQSPLSSAIVSPPENKEGNIFVLVGFMRLRDWRYFCIKD